MSWLKNIFGDPSASYLRSLEPLVEEVNGHEAALQALTAEQLLAKTREFKAQLREGSTADDILPEAFAVVREAARRALGQRHYDVQLLGGIILHQGKIAEMKTGEGKTLVCTLPAYLNALSGEGVHVVTVNDYLARRDAAWMGQVYAALGLTVGVINQDASYRYDPTHQEVDSERDVQGSYKVFHQFLKPCTRREAYEADITYGTNNEFGFDYLRDNLASSPEQVVQLSPKHTRHHYALVDEVDSILIDEARTPLIISAPFADSESLYQTFAKLVKNFIEETDYTVDRKLKAIHLTDEGITRAERALGIENIYTDKGIKYVHHLETAVRAKALFERDRDYVVSNTAEGREVVIVDEFTGRLQPGRRWSDGLHQAMEAKEGVEIRQESRTLATITFQNYFKLYEKVAGMTGTALTSAEEFLRVYGLDVVAVPTHRPSQRQDLNDLIFVSEEGKWQAIANKVKELHQKGQPVLIGTISIEKNELLAAYLKRAGVPHLMLNAKNHEQEGSIIAEAGKRGSVVVATNMAGRGVDIKLGGANATPEQAAAIRELGGLYVLGTERHDARRIDNQLRGRAGRQGDAGVTQFFVSLDDTLIKTFAPERLKGLITSLGLKADEPIQHRLVSRAIESAQQKIEGFNFDRRKHLLDYDNVLNQQRKAVYEWRNGVLFGAAGAAEKFVLDISEEATQVLAEKKAALGEVVFDQELRRLILQIIDLHWIEHLEAMEYMQSSVHLRAYGQRDPLVEYKREGLRLFRETEAQIKDEIVKLLPNLGIQLKVETAPLTQAIHDSVLNPSASGNSASAKAASSTVGRNDDCPCGSRKKYKKCGLLNTPEHQQLMAKKSV